MKRLFLPAALAVCLAGSFPFAAADTLPSDVRPNHWAAKAVPQALENGILSLQSDKQFHGDAKVTRAQTAIAIAKLARTLENNTWKKQSSVAIPDRVDAIMDQTTWKKQLVSRYVLAYTLTRMGNYVANGLPRPKPGVSDLGKSVAIEPVTISVPRSNPAYESLAYLAKNRMIRPNSPLLKADDSPIQGEEISRALTDMTVGLNDRLTSMNHDANGETPDATFHTKPKK